ncbi:MAG: repeat-containing protein YrrB [Bacteroidota bacterium]|jgi:tetratricopeptide (TPR) repeat protein
MRKIVAIIFFLAFYFRIDAQPNALVLQHLKKGANAFNTNNYMAAVQEFTEAIKLRPTFADSYFNRGYAKMRLKDYVGAIDDFDETIAWSPFDIQAHHLRGDAHRELKHYADAEADYTKAIDFGIAKPEAIYYKRAQVAALAKHYERSEKDYKYVMRFMPQLYGIYFKMGLLAYQNKHPKEAIEYLTKFLETQPANMSVRLFRASIASDEGLFDLAISDYSAALFKEPDNAFLYYQRGMAYYELAKKKEACRDFQQASFYGYAPATNTLRRLCQ